MVDKAVLQSVFYGLFCCFRLCLFKRGEPTKEMILHLGVTIAKESTKIYLVNVIFECVREATQPLPHESRRDLRSSHFIPSATK